MNAQQLLSRWQSEPEQCIACTLAGAQYTSADLCERIAHYLACMPHNKPSQTQWAIYHSNSFETLAMVMAVWVWGGCPLLAPNNLSGTCALMQPMVAGFLGEFPSSAQAPESPEPASLTIAKPQALTLGFFTSGSSGEPQCVIKQSEQLFNEVASLEHTFGPALVGHRVVASVSHQHIYGFLFRLLWPLVMQRLFFVDTLSYCETLADLGSEPLVWVASPTHLKRLPQMQKKIPLTTIFSSGSPLPANASDTASKCFNARVFEVYGSTETGGIGWRCQQQNGCLWTAFNGVELRTDANQQLQLRSPHLLDNQWYTCADRVAISDAGFELLGRADRVAKVEGKRVSLDQLEQRLLKLELVEDVRVEPVQRQGQVAVRDELMVIVVPRDAGLDRTILIGEMKNVLSELLEPALMPRRWRWVDRLPRNAQGKLQQQQMQQLAQSLMARTGE